MSSACRAETSPSLSEALAERMGHMRVAGRVSATVALPRGLPGMAKTGICLPNLSEVVRGCQSLGGSCSLSCPWRSSHPAHEGALGSAVLGQVLASGSQVGLDALVG